MLQESAVTYAFVQEALPLLEEKGVDALVYYVASAELFDLLPEDERRAIFPEARAAEAIGITGFTLPTLYRWVTSEAGRGASLYPFRKGHYLGSGPGDVVLAEAGLDGAEPGRRPSCATSTPAPAPADRRTRPHLEEEPMTEPREIAPAAEEVAPGLWHWRISNSNIGGHVSSSQALLTREGCVLVDPVRLDDAALGALPRPTATLLTARCHQRAAWRYRDELGAEVWLPEDATAADEQPDHTYADGQLLPGGLRAFRTPGPEWPHYSFLYEGDPGHRLLLGPAEQRRGRAALHQPGVPRGSRGDADERRSTARSAASGSCASPTARRSWTTPRPRCAQVLEQSELTGAPSAPQARGSDAGGLPRVPGADQPPAPSPRPPHAASSSPRRRSAATSDDAARGRRRSPTWSVVAGGPPSNDEVAASRACRSETSSSAVRSPGRSRRAAGSRPETAVVHVHRPAPSSGSPPRAPRRRRRRARPAACRVQRSAPRRRLRCRTARPSLARC